MNPEGLGGGNVVREKGVNRVLAAGKKVLGGLMRKNEEQPVVQPETEKSEDKWGPVIEAAREMAEQLERDPANLNGKVAQKLISVPGAKPEDVASMMKQYNNGDSLVKLVERAQEYYVAREKARSEEAAEQQRRAKENEQWGKMAGYQKNWNDLNLNILQNPGEIKEGEPEDSGVRAADFNGGVDPWNEGSEAFEVSRAVVLSNVKDKFLKKFGAGAAALTVAGLILGGAAVTSLLAPSETVEAGNSAPKIPQKRVEAPANPGVSENDVAEVEETESLLDNEALYQGNIDVSQFDLLALGNEQFKDFTEANYPNMQKDEFSGVVADYVKSGYMNYAEKASKNAISDKRLESTRQALENGDVEPTRDMVLETIKANPQELASTLSMLSPLLEQLGLGEIAEMENAGERAQKLSEMMLSSEKGADLQKQWYEAVELALKNENTKWSSEEMSGYGTSTFIKQIDEELGEKIANLTPGVSKVERADGDWHVKIGMPFKTIKEDGTESITTVTLYIRGVCINKDTLRSYIQKDDEDPIPISEDEQKELKEIEQKEKRNQDNTRNDSQTDKNKTEENVTTEETANVIVKDAENAERIASETLAQGAGAEVKEDQTSFDKPAVSVGDTTNWNIVDNADVSIDTSSTAVDAGGDQQTIVGGDGQVLGVYDEANNTFTPVEDGDTSGVPGEVTEKPPVNENSESVDYSVFDNLGDLGVDG